MRQWLTQHQNHVQLQNIGAKMLSARLAKVPNLLTTTLTSCLCNAIEHVAKCGEIRQTTTDRDNSGGLR